MITARPSHIFETLCDLESKVLDASTPMLECFHRTAAALSKGVAWHQVRLDVAKDLPSLLCTYLRTFKDWKLVDERKLAGRLKNALCGLEEAEAELLNLDPELDIRVELFAQMQRLRCIILSFNLAPKTSF